MRLCAAASTILITVPVANGLASTPPPQRRHPGGTDRSWTPDERVWLTPENAARLEAEEMGEAPKLSPEEVEILFSQPPWYDEDDELTAEEDAALREMESDAAMSIDEQFDKVLEELDTKWLWADEEQRRREMLLDDELDAAQLQQYTRRSEGMASSGGGGGGGGGGATSPPHYSQRRPAADGDVEEDARAGTQALRTPPTIMPRGTPRRHGPGDVEERLKGPPTVMSVAMGLLACNLLWFALYDSWATVGTAW